MSRTTNSNPDPLAIVADCLDVQNDEDMPNGAAKIHAGYILKALTDAGWRIVATADEEFPGEDVQIVHEWTPTAWEPPPGSAYIGPWPSQQFPRATDLNPNHWQNPDD